MTYTKRSFHFAIISLVILGLFLILSLVDRNASTRLDSIIGYCITLFFVTVTVGFVFALLSIKEKSTSRKAVGLVVNLGLAVWLAYHSLNNLTSIVTAFS